MDNIARNGVIYARRSQLQQSGASIMDQVAKGRQACDAEGWQTVAVIDTDTDRSASRFATKDRPGWARVLGLLRSGAANSLVLWESSRGDRKLHEWTGFLDEARRAGWLIHVVCDHRTYDVRNKRDWRTLAEDGIDAAYESEKISGRIKRGIEGAAMRGMPYPSLPTGYLRVYDPDTGRRVGWKEDPVFGPVVREIITRVTEHEPIQAIADDLNVRPLLSPRGGVWNQATIRQIAVNPAYIAIRVAPDGERVRGNWEPLVPEALWRDAQAVMANRTGPRPGKQVHMLTTLAVCRECNSDATTWRKRGRIHYKCRENGCFYISEEWLDEFVADVICARLARPDARDLFKSDDERSETLRNRAEELRAQLDEWAAADISARAYQVKEKQLLPQIEAAENELLALSVPPALLGIIGAADVRAAWDGYKIGARRAVIMAMTGVQVGRWDRVPPRLDERRVTFDWKPVRRPGKGQRKGGDASKPASVDNRRVTP